MVANHFFEVAVLALVTCIVVGQSFSRIAPAKLFNWKIILTAAAVSAFRVRENLGDVDVAFVIRRRIGSASEVRIGP